MIQQSPSVIFGHNSGVDQRTLKCIITFGQMIEGEIDNEINYRLSECFAGRRKKFKCNNFILTIEDCFWLVDYILDSDKTLSIDGTEYDVVNGRSNLDRDFDLIKNSNAKAQIELIFEERALAA